MIKLEYTENQYSDYNSRYALKRADFLRLLSNKLPTEVIIIKNSGEFKFSLGKIIVTELKESRLSLTLKVFIDTPSGRHTPWTQSLVITHTVLNSSSYFDTLANNFLYLYKEELQYFVNQSEKDNKKLAEDLFLKEFKEKTKFPYIDSITSSTIRQLKKVNKLHTISVRKTGATFEMCQKINELVIFLTEYLGSREELTIVVGVENVRDKQYIFNALDSIMDESWVCHSSSLVTPNWEIAVVSLTSPEMLKYIIGKNIVALFIDHTVVEFQISDMLNNLFKPHPRSELINKNIQEIRQRISFRKETK